jgi:TPR repeat protein
LFNAAQQGDAAAQLELGTLMIQSGETDLGVGLIGKAALQGYADAQKDLGTFYLNGTFVTPDLAKAIELFEKASSQGNAGALAALGGMYTLGKGVIKNPVKGLELFEKAALQGSAAAQYTIGVYYAKGEGGVAQDLNKAIEWLDKAAKQGNPYAPNVLGMVREAAAEHRIATRQEDEHQAAHEAKISELRGKFGKDLTEEQLFAKELKTEDVKRKKRNAKQITVYVFSIVGAIVLAIGGIALAGSGHIIIGLIGIVAGIVVFVKKWDIVEYFDKKQD